MTLNAIRPDAPPESLSAGAPAAARHSTPKWCRMMATVLWLLALVALVAVLWPARWGGFIGLTVVSGHSMEPTYTTGDLVVTVRQSCYLAGDIVAYQVPAGQPGAGGHVIHRIASVAPAGAQQVLTTKGDNNPTADVWHPATSDVLGRALIRLPAIGKAFGGGTYNFLIAIVPAALVTWLLWPGKKKRAVTHRHGEGDPGTDGTGGTQE